MNKRSTNKIIIASVIALLIAVFIYLDLGSYFTLGYLKESQGHLQEIYLNDRLTVIAAYMLIYIAVTALSLPGAAVMTIAGGALFGLTVGIVAVSFASTVGATLACFFSRYILRDWVQKNLGKRFKAINEGVEREGAYYLFTARLIPVFPFFVINLAMGLTKMPLFRFFWVSQLGMLAGTAVYVNAGRELGKIESLSGILAPGLILSFAILGLFPMAAKKFVAFIRKRLELRKSAKESFPKSVR
ncbi:MAG: TVP38/TMEM64 family protein [bacterium]|nr:TVP38/TMEM64 family protein [bacterium]